MADEYAAVSDLRELREALVARRREIAAGAARLRRDRHEDDRPDETKGARSGADLAAVQVQIEAVDGAIADEKVLGPTEADVADVPTHVSRDYGGRSRGDVA